jgi:hypothetical protein
VQEPAQTVRLLRFELASALFGGSGNGRGAPEAEALDLLDRAIEEPGAEPSDGRIHLAAAEILERRRDAPGALERCLLAAGDEPAEAIARARRLLDEARQPGALVGALRREAIERLLAVARREPAGQAPLLAATVLRERGELERCAEVLQRACADVDAPPHEVAAMLADVELTLGRRDAAREILGRCGAAEQGPALGVVLAKVHVMDGEIAEAHAIAQRIWVHTESPAAAAVRALCLIALHGASEALEALPATDEPDVQSARVIVALALADEARAREASFLLARARPKDRDAQLLSAQAAAELLGVEPGADPAPGSPAVFERGKTDEAETGGRQDVGPTSPSAEIKAMRQLLERASAALPYGGTRSFWWMAQDAIRGTQSRYRFFRAELRHATGTAVDVEELDAIDVIYTTWLQDAALAELKAKTLEADPVAAAAAHDEARSIFVGHAPDPTRALYHARAAWDRAPSPVRATELAYCTFDASFGEDVATKDLQAALEAGRPLLGEADDDDFIQLVHAMAWVWQRLGDLNEQRSERPGKVSDDSSERPDDVSEDSSAARLSWLLAGAAAESFDGALLADAAWAAGDLDYEAAAVLLAATGVARQPDSPEAVIAALATDVNYYGDRSRVSAYLNHPSLSDEPQLRNSVELALAVDGGDGDVARALELPVLDDAWVKRTRALGATIAHGPEAATPLLDEALDASRSDRRSRWRQALVAAALGRIEDVQRLAEEEARSPRSAFSARECALVARFVTDHQMTPEEFVHENLALCRCRGDVLTLVNMALPVLVAGRTRSRPPVQIPRELQPAIQTRLAELSDPAARWLVERDGAPGWARLAELSLHAGEPGTLARAIGALPPPDLPAPVIERLERLALRRAFGQLPRRALEALAGRRPPVDDADLAALFDPKLSAAVEDRLAVSLLLRPTAPNLDGALTPDVIEAAAAAIVSLIPVADHRSAPDAAVAMSDLWLLDAKLREVEGDPALGTVAAIARQRLMTALDDLLGLRRAPEPDPYVTPVIGEIGDALVPFVDDKQDGGYFLFELIPAMREGVRSATGVEVPGVHMRSDPALAPGAFTIMIDEVAAHGGAIDVDADDPSAPRALLPEIEVVLRWHLDRFLGPDDVERMVARWRSEDEEGLVGEVLPDAGAVLRLTWVLQALAREGVSIVDWRAILRIIRHEGGFERPQPELHRALREALLEHLPGRGPERRLVTVPAHLEQAVAGQAPADAPADLRLSPGHAFHRWLSTELEAAEQPVTLVVEMDEARAAVDALAHLLDARIATMSTAEVARG